MNIDFHYGVIYVTSRLAGLSVSDAQVVAHACQYVDDATTDGLLKFSGGETFERCASAHEMCDYENAIDSQNRMIWVPFHFLPAGEGETLDDKAVCRPDSEVARAMVRKALIRHEADNALHRLGVTLHVYIDTWAHQGFSGVASDNNRLLFLEGDDHSHETWAQKLEAELVAFGQNIGAGALDAVSGLGHGAALHFPDMPWAKWKYRNKKDQEIERENLEDFMQAADMACKVVQGFIAQRADYEGEPGLSEAQKAALRKLLENNRDHDADARFSVIAKAVGNGEIPGLREKIPQYIAKGEGSWKHAATGIAAVHDGNSSPTWTPAFEASHYRKFHDATKEHRFVVTQEILPAFKVRLA